MQFPGQLPAAPTHQWFKCYSLHLGQSINILKQPSDTLRSRLHCGKNGLNARKMIRDQYKELYESFDVKLNRWEGKSSSASRLIH